jgi:hypothetical protein
MRPGARPSSPTIPPDEGQVEGEWRFGVLSEPAKRANGKKKAKSNAAVAASLKDF